MDFLTGKTEKETLEISQILAGDYEGKEIRINGAIHKIRDMGDVAFIVLRKREGLVQTVYESGATNISLKELSEEAAVEVRGTVTKEERAPHGFELRLKEVKILSRPIEPMPIAINKWKMNTSLETKLDLRPLSLRLPILRLVYGAPSHGNLPRHSDRRSPGSRRENRRPPE